MHAAPVFAVTSTEICEPLGRGPIPCSAHEPRTETTTQEGLEAVARPTTRRSTTTASAHKTVTVMRGRVTLGTGAAVSPSCTGPSPCPSVKGGEGCGPSIEEPAAPAASSTLAFVIRASHRTGEARTRAVPGHSKNTAANYGADHTWSLLCASCVVVSEMESTVVGRLDYPTRSCCAWGQCGGNAAKKPDRAAERGTYLRAAIKGRTAIKGPNALPRSSN